MYDPSTLYTDPILSNFSTGYRFPTLVGERIFPITPVGTKSGRYRVFNRADWLIFPDRREPGTVANEIRGRRWSEDTFSVKEHSLQAPVHDEERQELSSLGGYANPAFGGALQIDPERDAVALCTRSILLGEEKKIADAARNTANYAAGHFVTLAGAQQWDDYTGGTASTSNPQTDIQAAIRKIYQDTGRYPNVMLIPTLGMPYIENHPRIVDRFKNFALSVPDAFRTLTGFEGEIIPVESVYNAADNIDATESITSLWGKDVILAVVDDTPGQETQTFGKTFAQPYPDGSVRPTDRWREEPRKSDLFRVSMNYDIKIVSNVAAYVIKTAFSAGAF
jgi:hypothetical protein